jgi:hypothetical protein
MITSNVPFPRGMVESWFSVEINALLFQPITGHINTEATKNGTAFETFILLSVCSIVTPSAPETRDQCSSTCSSKNMYRINVVKIK